MNKQTWTEIPAVQKQIAKASQCVAEAASIDYWQAMYGNLPLEEQLESPLEAIFWLWWEAYRRAHDVWFTDLHLFVQEPVEYDGVTFRLDFVVGLSDQQLVEPLAQLGFTFPEIAIEVDGHEFHERTPEQVAARNQRDRVLQKHGWRVFHFSWRELTEDAEAQLDEVLDFVIPYLRDLHGLKSQVKTAR